MSCLPPVEARCFGPAWSEHAVLMDGTPVILRHLRLSDAPLLQAAMQQLSPHTRYLRFHGPKTELSPEEARTLSGVDGWSHVALGAFTGRPQRLAGVGRFIRHDGAPDAAEMAITVEDRLQGCGLGSLLLSRMRLAALERGITRFTGEVLDENRRMLGFLRKLRARVGLPSRGVRTVDLSLG